MNLIVQLSRLKADPRRLTTIRLGMPHLTPHGLSETWLLKELGDVHWQLLAEQAGCSPARIEDRDGNRVYAAFRQVRIARARLGEAREDDRLAIRSALWRASRTQLLSRHDLDIDGSPIGTITLVSAFIRRDGRSNHRVSRVEVPGFAILPVWDGLKLEPAPAPIEMKGASRFAFTPCPSEDFNGAGFLYFSSYAAIAERAAFALAPGRAQSSSTVERTLSYHGNIDPGEGIEAVSVETPLGPRRSLLRCDLRRAGDRALLAQVSTERHLRGS